MEFKFKVKAKGSPSEMSALHPGFKKVAAMISKQSGIKNPGAVLASKTRSASPAAKKKNPMLLKVKG